MRWSHPTRVAVVAGLLLSAGCASQSSSTSAISAATGASSTSGAPSSPTPGSTTASATAAIPSGYEAGRNASADIAAALATASRKHQEVLVDFGANWCPDCVALDSMFHSAEVEPLLTKDYVAVPVDVGNWNLNLDVAARYVNLQTSGIPALVVLAPNGKVITTTNDGSFSNARTMTPSDVATFLGQWAPSSSG